jgi:hypothetical protein
MYEHFSGQPQDSNLNKSHQYIKIEDEYKNNQLESSPLDDEQQDQLNDFTDQELLNN